MSQDNSIPVIIIGIGNGLRPDGSLSAVSREVADSVFEVYRIMEGEKHVVFSGGYKVNSITEAEAMSKYFNERYGLLGHTEKKSYRTHNNAIEGILYAKKLSDGRKAKIVVVDHPEHFDRTKLAFKAAIEAYSDKDKFYLDGVKTKEVYDPEVFRQPQWTDKKSFSAYEKRRMRLYKTLLRKPWNKLGLKFLKRIWPSHRQ